MYYLQRNFIVWASLVLASAMSFSTMTQATDIYFSEYSEPANAKWYNRYVEIYNASGASIDLLDYALLWCENKCANNIKYNKVIYFTTGDRYLADGATYTVSVNNGNRDILIKNATDALGMANNNYKITGNDPIALVKKAATWNGTNYKNQIKHYTVLDVIGQPKKEDTDDFTGVCGSSTLATVVLIKKPAKQGNTSWANSKGTSASDCDWTVKAATDYSNVGQHTVSSGDATVPVITLSGNQIVEVALNASYSDAGATASDDTDGTITGDIVTGNAVDTAVAGTYAVTYNVSDAANNAAAQVVRAVVVDPWSFNASKQGWSGSGGVSVAAGTTYATLTFDGPGKNYPNFDSSEIGRAHV